VRFHEGVQYYELTNLPGCSQVVVSHDLFIRPSERRKGKSHAAMQKRLAHMRELGYNYVICTVNAANEAEIKALGGSGWKLLDMFFSSKTEHTVQLWGKVL
jgi:predicted acetyltransferase